MSLENQIKNCTKCEKSFEPLYYEDELCDFCDYEDLNMNNGNENELENGNHRINQSGNPYNIMNMMIYPLIFSFLVGLYENGLSFLFNSSNLVEVLLGEILPKGFVYLLMAYYPFKIFSFILNRFTKGKWEWPYSLEYLILPVILFFLMVYIRF